MTREREAGRARVEAVNAFLEEIASVGRQFFRDKSGRVTRFELDARGRVWLIDKWREDRVFTHYAGRWRGFTEGGTLRYLCCALRDFIRMGDPVPAHHFGPWPAWMCDGDPWGYGDGINHVRESAARLGITAPAALAALETTSPLSGSDHG